MSRPTFGTPDKVDNAGCQEALAKIDPTLREALKQMGLHNISCLNPSSGFIQALVENHILTSQDFIYGDDVWHDEACAGTGHPTAVSIKAFLVSIAADLTWINVADAARLRADQSTVASRMMRVYKSIFDISSKASTSVDDDLPMSDETTATATRAFNISYGFDFETGGLASLNMMNKLHTMFKIGFKVIPVHNFQRRDQVVETIDEIVTDVTSGKTKVRTASKKTINSTFDFLMALTVMVDSLVFLGPIHQAPAEEWSGNATTGIVRGTRLQISRRGGDVYISFWSKYMPLYASSIGALIKAEAEVRATWISKFADKKSLETCIYESIADLRSQIVSFIPQKQHGNETGKGGGAQLSRNAKKRKAAEEAAANKPQQAQQGAQRNKPPGFQQGLVTFQGEHNGKTFCKHWNDDRGCWHAAACTRWHKCDVKKPDGTPCFAEHQRCKHV